VILRSVTRVTDFTMFTYDSEDESIDPMLEGYDSDIAEANRKKIRRNYEKRQGVKRRMEAEDDLVPLYTETDFISSLHVPLQLKKHRTIYDSHRYRKSEQERIDSVTHQLQEREAYFARLKAEIATNQQSRMLRELDEYGLQQNKKYLEEARERKARQARALRQKNEYLLRNHFINVLNTK